MRINNEEKIFNSETGTKTYVLTNIPNNANACESIGLSVESGSVTVTGKMTEDDTAQAYGLINLATGEITDTATTGAYSVLGAENLYSVTFTATESTEATAKFLY